MSSWLNLSGSEKRKKHNPLVLEKATSATSTAEAVEELSMSSNDQTADGNCDDSKCDESNLDCTNAEDVQSEDARS